MTQATRQHTYEVTRAANGDFRVLLFDDAHLHFTWRFVAARDAEKVGQRYAEGGFVPNLASLKDAARV